MQNPAPQKQVLEAVDPVAYPHYPPRIPRAARPVYSFVEEANEEPTAQERVPASNSSKR